MNKKTLLLDANFRFDRFIGFKKTMKMLIKGKVEVLESWDDYIYYGNGKIKYPSVLKLVKSYSRNYISNSFSRKGVINRDANTCMYCGKILSNSAVTIDHVIPKSQGGPNSYTNCVVACQNCNGKKANCTPEQAGLILIRKPQHPTFIKIRHNSDNFDNWNDDWNDYLNV